MEVDNDSLVTGTGANKDSSTTTTGPDLEFIRGINKSDLIIPKLPLVDSSTGKRQDGRRLEEVRQLYVETGVRGGVRGSSYIEMGDTKVICVVNGPKELPKKVDFSTTGTLLVEVQAVGSKVPEKDIILLKEALEAVVILEKFPKLLLEIFLTILEDNGSSTAACITAAGLALVDAGVPVYDTPVGGSLLSDGSQIFLDPSRSEHQCLDLADSTKNNLGGGVITMGYLPSRDQICLFTMEGKMEPETLTKCMDTLVNMNIKTYALVRHYSLKKIKAADGGDDED